MNITLEEYLKEDSKITEFFGEQNNDFWKNLKLSAEIPVDNLKEIDPTCLIVGKEKEIRAGKRVNWMGAQVELERERRFNSMFMLLMEIDFLKKRGFRTEIESVESKMENHADYDWETDYKNAISGLESEGKYNRKKSVKFIFRNLEKLTLDAEVDYKRIADKLKLELPTPPIFYLEGPNGSGKSFIQTKLQLSYMKLAKELGIHGFDILAIKDPLDPNKPKVIKLLGGEGTKLTTYYDNLMRDEERRKKFKNKALIGGIIAFPIYYVVKVGLELVKYSWGGGLGVDPMLDAAMWINANKNWIFWISCFGIGSKLVNAEVDHLNKSKSKRPEWLGNSKDMPPVYVGSVGRENLEGEFISDSNLPPQSQLRGSGLLSGDGKVVISEQLPEFKEDEQSLISQIIQEREVSIGNRGEHTVDLFPILYLGANTYKVKDLIPALRDRLQLGESCYVVNEVERDKKIEKHLFTFLEDYRKRKGGKSFTIEALNYLTEISSTLAENKNKLEISRKYLSIVDKSIDLAKGSNAEVIIREHIIEALKSTESLTEQRLKVKREEKNIYEEEKMKIGTVRILGYVTDRYMIEHESEDIKKELEEENGVGYISQVRAIAGKGNNELDLIIPKNWRDKRENLKKSLSLLLGKKMENKKITVDLTKIFEEDETLLLAMYAAVSSAIEGKKIRQDIAVAVSCDLEGKLVPLRKINKRIYTVDKKSSIAVSSYDADERINSLITKPMVQEIYSEDSLNNLYEVLTNEI